MTDINKVELSVGDYILVAFSSCGYTYLEYATIIKLDDSITHAVAKVRFESSSYFKNKTLKSWDGKSRILKIRGND